MSAGRECPACGSGKTRDLVGPADGGWWQVCRRCAAISVADATGPPAFRVVPTKNVLVNWPEVAVTLQEIQTAKAASAQRVRRVLFGLILVSAALFWYTTGLN